MRLRGYSFADAEDAKRAKAGVIEALGSVKTTRASPS